KVLGLVAPARETVGRRQGGAIRRKGQRVHAVLMPEKLAQLLAGGHIPETDDVVPAPGGQSLAVRREGQAVKANDAHTRLELPDHLAGRDFPERDAVRTAGCQGPSIRRQGTADIDAALALRHLKAAQLAACGRLPYSNVIH